MIDDPVSPAVGVSACADAQHGISYQTGSLSLTPCLPPSSIATDVGEVYRGPTRNIEEHLRAHSEHTLCYDALVFSIIIRRALQGMQPDQNQIIEPTISKWGNSAF